MGENTNISWADHTFNAWIGCTKVSPGCCQHYKNLRQINHNPTLYDHPVCIDCQYNILTRSFGTENLAPYTFKQ